MDTLARARGLQPSEREQRARPKGQMRPEGFRP